ncbi:MAG: galactokinase [Acidobacteriota bacterium]|nr:galactokinase [Acidobacteriota bacterium]
MSIRLFVPGRIEIVGKHTDYAGGRSLVAAVPRGFTFSASPSADGRVEVTDLGTNQHAQFAADGSGPGADGWQRYPQAVISRLAANFPGAALSARIEFSSDLPPAAGLSSSSALVIGMAEALIACARIEDTQTWQREIRTLEDRASYFGCIENGSRFGALLGSDGVGTHGGSEDHAAIVMSVAGHMRRCAFAPLRSEGLVAMPAGWTFVVAASGVEAHKTGAARGAFNRLADPAAMAGGRLRQFEAENARVDEAAGAFARGDVARVGELAAASQRDADALLGNQVPETRALVALALAEGASAASAFGAGWGGSVWALVETAAGPAFLERWLGGYRLRYPQRRSIGFVSPPCDGMHKVNPSPYNLSR